MTNQEVVQILREYVQMDQQLTHLLQQKKDLEKEIKHYQIPREAPTPKHPSKLGIFFTDLAISIVVLSVIISIADISNDIFQFWGPVILTCILFPIHYKSRDSEACAQYVTAGMRYQEWEQGKQTRLPVLQNQLTKVIDEGNNLYQKFQNARATKLLHPDYLPYTRTLLSYFDRGRVRDLTDAINLFEQESREHHRDKEMAAYRNEMLQHAQAQTAATEEAAAAAHEAAFWGAAATFMAAVNTPKDNNNDYHVV